MDPFFGATLWASLENAITNQREPRQIGRARENALPFFLCLLQFAIMVKLDTSVKSHRLDAEGNTQPTAVDLISGETFVKVAKWMPWKHPRSAKEGVHVEAEALAEKGAHQEHCADEWFRGVWIPLENDEPVEETAAADEDAPAPSRGRRNKKK